MRKQIPSKHRDSTRLTIDFVKSLVPPENGYYIKYDPDLTGFGVRVTANGVKTFIAESRVNGKTRRPQVGRFGVVTPAEARKKAKRELAKMSDGVDPSAEKRREKALGVTLEEVATAYLKNRRTRDGKPLKPRTKADVEYHLNTNFPDWKEKPIVTITREMVQKRYTKHAKSSEAQAGQSMRVLSCIINYAAATYRMPDGARIITDNPVDVLRETSVLCAVEPRKNKVDLDKIGRWWSVVEAMRHDPALTAASRSAADLVALIALTGLRLGEARAIQWEHLDLESGALRLTDTKNRTNVTLPLSDAAVEILQARRNSGRYVFPARSGNGHLLRIETHLSKIAEKSGITVTAHDLRRTFSAVAAEVEVELWRTKALMGHKQKEDVTLHQYKDLSDVRFLKPEADRIANYFEEQRRIYEADNVVKLERRA